MDFSFVSNPARKVLQLVSHNSPTILTGFGVAGVITTTILAVKATPKALLMLQEKSYSHYEEDRDNRNGGTYDQYMAEHGATDSFICMPVLTIQEIIETSWKEYIPAVIMGGVSIACIIGANSINLRRNAALASLYSIADTTLKEYQSQVVKQIGAKKEEKVREELAQRKLDNDPIDGKTVIVTGKGEMLCYEALSGRYFNSDIETIRRIQNDFNKRLLSENELRLNDLYCDLGLESVDIGNDVGWSTSHYMLDIVFSAKIAKDGRPCIVVGYKDLPTKLW